MEEYLKKIPLAELKKFTLITSDLLEFIVRKADEDHREHESFQRTNYLEASWRDTEPDSGWLDPDEVRKVASEMNEAIAVRDWFNGAVAAIKIMRML